MFDKQYLGWGGILLGEGGGGGDYHTILNHALLSLSVCVCKFYNLDVRSFE